MKEELYGIIPVANTEIETRKLDIIFIHGLGGHAETTWGDTNDNFWPSWLDDDFTDIGIWTIGYDATPSAWIRDTMPMKDRALNILNNLSLTETLGTRPIVFIVHSMGGLILKYMLNKSKMTNMYGHILKHTKGIVFLAVPHDGAGGANILSAFNEIFLLRINDIVKQLKKNSSELDDLAESFNILAQQENIKCISFFETKELRYNKKLFGFIPLPKGIKIVSKVSARGRFPQPEPIGVDEDHISICKLKDKNDLVYKNVKPFIQSFLDEINKYDDIVSGLEETTEKNESLINQIFLVFNENNRSENKYEVTGYIQCDNEFENDLIEYAFENINNQDEQEKFLEILIKSAELDKVPIHFIIPSSLFLVNFKQWKYRGNELIKLYDIVLHNQEMFLINISRYKKKIDDWNELFEKLKDNHIATALSSVHSDNERFDTREEKIGVCFKYSPSNYEAIKNITSQVPIGLWQYPQGNKADYQEWTSSGVYLNQLRQSSRNCDHTALLWDDMSMLEKLKRRE